MFSSGQLQAEMMMMVKKYQFPTLYVVTVTGMLGKKFTFRERLVIAEMSLVNVGHYVLQYQDHFLVLVGMGKSSNTVLLLLTKNLSCSFSCLLPRTRNLV